MKPDVVETRKVIPYGKSYFAVVPDPAAGARFRYTVYELPTTGGKEALVIGRELDLRTARRVVAFVRKKRK